MPCSQHYIVNKKRRFPDSTLSTLYKSCVSTLVGLELVYSVLCELLFLIGCFNLLVLVYCFKCLLIHCFYLLV